MFVKNLNTLANFRTALALTVLSATVSVTAFAADEFIFYSPKEAAAIRSRMQTSPLNPAKVKENLEKVANLVLQKNAGLLDSMSLKAEDKKGLIENAFIISAVAKSKYFTHFNLALKVSEGMSPLIIYTVDKISLRASLGINSYEMLKTSIAKLLTEGPVASNQTRDPIKEFEKLCKNELDGESAKRDPVSGMICRLGFAAMKSQSYSEFLVLVAPHIQQLQAQVNTAISEQIGTAHYLTSFKASVCNQQSWFCWTPGVYAKASATGLGLASFSLSVGITEREISVDFSIKARRQALEAVLGGLGGQVTGIDLVKYELFKHIETMSEQEIQASADQISKMISQSIPKPAQNRTN